MDYFYLTLASSIMYAEPLVYLMLLIQTESRMEPVKIRDLSVTLNFL